MWRVWRDAEGSADWSWRRQTKTQEEQEEGKTTTQTGHHQKPHNLFSTLCSLTSPGFEGTSAFPFFTVSHYSEQRGFRRRSYAAVLWLLSVSVCCTNTTGGPSVMFRMLLKLHMKRAGVSLVCLLRFGPSALTLQTFSWSRLACMRRLTGVSPVF